MRRGVLTTRFIACGILLGVMLVGAPLARARQIRCGGKALPEGSGLKYEWKFMPLYLTSWFPLLDCATQEPAGCL